MRLIYILPYQYPYKTGGAEINYHFLLKNLPDDIDITTVSYHFADGIRNWMIKKKKPTSISLPFQIIHKLYHRRDDYDMIHVPFMRSASFLTWIIYPIVKKLTGKPYVIAIHGGGMKKWGWKAPYRWFFRQAKAISAPSESIAKEYRSRSDCDITVIPSLIPFKKSRVDKKSVMSEYGFSSNDKIFLSVGSLKEIKAPMSILKAFNVLGEDFIGDNALSSVLPGTGLKKR
jgi:glycosyltransferase involved in cell wall biosynthesis